jgi:hypothetical protein
MCDSVWWRRARGALVNDFLMPTAKFYCVLTLISVGVLWLIVHFLPTTLSDGRPNLTLRDLQSRPLHGHYALFVAIISTPNHFRDRHVARRTWLRHAERSNARIAHRFFVGTPEDDASNATEADDEFVSSTASESREVRRRLAEEYAVYGDTVQLDSLDSYERLPHKVMDMFRWVAAMHANGNCSIDFVLKTDDDSYVRVDRLLQHLRAEPDGDSLYWGFFNLGSKKTRVDGIAHTSVNSAQRAAKWLDPVFNGTHYAPYALGAGYALSLALVTRIVNHATRRDDAAPPSRMEDAATGLYLDSAHGRVRRVDVWWRSVPAVRSGSNSALCQVRRTGVCPRTRVIFLLATAGGHGAALARARVGADATLVAQLRALCTHVHVCQCACNGITRWDARQRER